MLEAPQNIKQKLINKVWNFYYSFFLQIKAV